MKPFAAFAALAAALAALVLPASARDSYVIDDAHMLSAQTISAINSKVGDFYAQTHKEVVVLTVPSLSGTAADAEERAFAQQQVNGVLIFIAKSPKTIGVIPDRAAAHYFPPGATAAIRDAIRSAFNAGNFDGGVTNGVDLTLAEYRSHLGSLRATEGAPNYAPVQTAPARTTGGFNMSFIWWLIALAVIFFIVRGIFRAIAGPRMYPPGYGGGPMGGYGGYGGYGPGYGGGGGSFWSGMLGGLGGAFLGNELFGGNRTQIIEQNPGMQAGFGGQPYGDAGGFQSDAGQADMGNAASGSWGDSGGGGWGDVGGGGDFGSGGDFGGGDSGGGGGW